MKIYVGHFRNFDYEKELYQPLRKSKLNNLAEIILPHENGREFYDSKAGLKDMDYMIAEVSYPSTGLGIEIGWADFYGIPIIAVYKHGAQPSGSVKRIAAHLVEYLSVNELIEQIQKIIKA
jgi:hypothetical protein